MGRRGWSREAWGKSKSAGGGETRPLGRWERIADKMATGGGSAKRIKTTTNEDETRKGKGKLQKKRPKHDQHEEKKPRGEKNSKPQKQLPQAKALPPGKGVGRTRAKKQA